MLSSSEESTTAPTLGDYRLLDLISEGACTRTYRAKQISIDRVVILERIKPEIEADREMVEQFLADVRAKASVSTPTIGSVYEAVDRDDAVFYTRELLAGDNLEGILHEGATFSPVPLVGFLKQVADAMDALREDNVATLGLEPRHLVIGRHDVLRVANLAVAGPPDPLVEAHDRHLVAEIFHELLRPDDPGSDKVNELLVALTPGERDPLAWNEIFERAHQLERELAEPPDPDPEPERPASPPVPARHVKVRAPRVAPPAQLHPSSVAAPGIRSTASKRRASKAMLIGGGVALALLAAVWFLFFRGQGVPEARNLRAMVAIPAGSYPDRDGSPVEIEQFWIDAHEVSIGEYAEFLEVLAFLPAATRHGYDHPKQPSDKNDHLPADWDDMLAAARTGGEFNGRRIDLAHPVTGVDWWDAYAYAGWRSGRLLREGEWEAAMEGEALSASGPGPVDTLPGDVTSRGVHGLAGNVAEWVGEYADRTTFPVKIKKPLCRGGSHLAPGEGAATRTWPSSRNERRSDLGFRIGRDAPPHSESSAIR